MEAQIKPPPIPTAPDGAVVREVAAFRERLLTEMSKVVVGQRDVVDLILTSLLSGGHCLLTGVPGLAKTLMIRSVGKLLDLKFSRIQFTPDLMPSDIIGTEILEEERATGHREFRFVKGPVFANILLADEINRTPPKTQSALLEAMQEHRVTTCGRTFHLDDPFFVLATQNPIEQAGTYPLPEAQLDRFMFNLRVDYLPEHEEVDVVLRTTSEWSDELTPILPGDRLRFYQSLVRSVPVSEHVALYAVRLASATRPNAANPFEHVRKLVTWGAGIRGGQQIILAAKAWALLHGRYHVSVKDVQQLAVPALRHRVITNYFAESEGVTPDGIVKQIIEKLPEPKSGIR
jgi:MoxR-like ATPase